MTDRVETLLSNLRDVESDREALGRMSEEHRTRVSAHETSIASLHVQNAELRQTLDAIREKYARAAAETERLRDVDAVLAQTTRELDAAIREKTDLQKSLDDTRTRLAALEKRTTTEIEHLESALRVARAEERDHADRLEAARSDNALLQGAIDALRKDHAQLREAIAGAPPASQTADAAQGEHEVLALRQAIVDLGARMAEIAAAPTANSNEAAQTKRAL
jgi:chromosome segregation ATPase